MNIGEAGLSLIKEFEKCRLCAYKPTPNDVWTIGWGHTGADVDETTLWTQEHADAALRNDLKWVEECVNKAVTADLTPNEFDALCSLCFNIGCSAFGKSTLVKLLNENSFEAAALEFRRWDKQAGQVLPGLTRRRMSEARLFETP